MIWKIKKALRNPFASSNYFFKKVKKKNAPLVNEELEISFDGQIYLGNPGESGIAKSIFQTGYWEYFTTQKFKQMIGRNDCVVDIGAAGGYFSLIAAKRATKVIAFEPIPNQRELLARNLSKNKYQNCVIAGYALLNENTTKILSKPGVKSRISIENQQLTFGNDELLVDCKRFDEIKSDLHDSTIDVVKMDIEGAEYHALQGMYDTLLKDHPRMLIELHPNLFSEFGYSTAEIFDFLEALDYQILPVDVSQSTLKSVRQEKIMDNIVVYCVKK